MARQGGGQAVETGRCGVLEMGFACGALRLHGAAFHFGGVLLPLCRRFPVRSVPAPCLSADRFCMGGPGRRGKASVRDVFQLAGHLFCGVSVRFAACCVWRRVLLALPCGDVCSAFLGRCAHFSRRGQSAWHRAKNHGTGPAALPACVHPAGAKPCTGVLLVERRGLLCVFLCADAGAGGAGASHAGRCAHSAAYSGHGFACIFCVRRQLCNGPSLAGTAGAGRACSGVEAACRLEKHVGCVCMCGRRFCRKCGGAGQRGAPGGRLWRRCPAGGAGGCAGLVPAGVPLCGRAPFAAGVPGFVLFGTFFLARCRAARGVSGPAAGAGKCPCRVLVCLLFHPHAVRHGHHRAGQGAKYPVFPFGAGAYPA